MGITGTSPAFVSYLLFCTVSNQRWGGTWEPNGMYTLLGVHLCQSPLQDGKYVQTAMSVEHPILPPQPGIVRAQVSVQEVLTSSFLPPSLPPSTSSNNHPGKRVREDRVLYSFFNNYFLSQLHPGSGWVLEPYEGNPSKTLISYLAHVSISQRHNHTS